MNKRTISIIMAIILIAGIGAAFAAEQAVDMTESEYANIPDIRDGEYINGITFENILEYFHVSEEQKEYVYEMIEQDSSEDEIADIMTWLLRSNNQYTIERLVVPESEHVNIPYTKDEEYLNSSFALVVEIIFAQMKRENMFILAEFVFSEELGKYVIVDAFDKTYIMDQDCENINLNNLKEYIGLAGLIDGVTVSYMPLGGLANSSTLGEFKPYWLESKSQVDGTTRYDLKTLRIGYGRLNPENLPDKYVTESETEKEIQASFGWEKTGEKYNLRACTVVTLDIKGVERNIVTSLGKKVVTADIKKPDGSVIRTIDARVFYDFRDTSQIVFKFARSEYYLEDTQGYFSEETNIKWVDGMTFDDFVKYSDIPEETKEYIYDRIKEDLTEDEIAEILLMLRSVNNWYTKDNIVDMTESEYSNIPDVIGNKYVESRDLDTIEIVLNNEGKARIYIIAKYIFSEETNKWIIVDAFDNTYLMDENYQNINIENLVDYIGLNEITEIRHITPGSVSRALGCEVFRPYLLKSIEEIDGKKYYNLEVLRIGYGRLNSENLPTKYVKEEYQAESDGN